MSNLEECWSYNHTCHGVWSTGWDDVWLQSDLHHHRQWHNTVKIQIHLNKPIHFNCSTKLVNIVNLHCHKDSSFLVCCGQKTGKEELMFWKEHSASILGPDVQGECRVASPYEVHDARFEVLTVVLRTFNWSAWSSEMSETTYPMTHHCIP